ncbi:uncharacterized protein [Halyomorpha halys]|uniref:uncharacterized protein n=1 Tax=Halyomorpha halys TaxID=286706 RepID=UPI0006D4EA60|nr:uncharacterized protein LOC106690329 [Halyomorpha halys]XP_014291218.1 uncharacterized protein LOC106690329 [Halyomorpha halys]
MLFRGLLIFSTCIVLGATKTPWRQEEDPDDPTEKPEVKTTINPDIKPTTNPDVKPTDPTVPTSLIDNLLENILYIPITDVNGQVVGYYTYIPNFNQVITFPYGFNGQILQTLLQRGLIPIYDIFGRFWGFFATSVGGGQQPDIKILATNLFIHGLYPVQNGKGQIIAIYKIHRNYPTSYHINFLQNQGKDL